MSYDVVICPPDVSPDDESAWSESNRLADALEFGESPSTQLKHLHDHLTAKFPCISDLPDDRIDEGVWSVGPLIKCFGQRVAVLSFAFSAVDQVLPVLIAAANSQEMTVFDSQTQTIHRPGDLVLTVEDRDDVRNPTAEQINVAIEGLTPNGGPGFAVLDGTRDYVQSAGGDGLFTVEWRQYHGESFQHFVAGKEGDALTDFEVPTNGFQVTVKKNECLNMQEVKSLFQTFQAGGDRPTNFAWRDVTDRFK